MTTEMEYGHDFRKDEPWRIFRIMAEFVEGTEDMAQVMPAVSIFGSARTEPEHRYYKMGCAVAAAVAERGFNIITGGGPGIMEAANRGAKEASTGESVGLNIELPFEQVANPYISRLISFRYFFVRKVMFLKYASAVIVLPGGFGTFDEFFESVTLVQTRKMPKLPIYLMGSEFWQGMLDWVRGPVLDAGNISAEDVDLFTLSDDPEEVAEGVLAAYRAGQDQEAKTGAPAPGDGM